MAYFNNNQNNTPAAQDTGRDVWQRQQDILSHLKNAEEEIFKGISLQNTFYDKEFGSMRNHHSIGFMLTGAIKYHFILQTLLKDTTGTGVDSEKDSMYKLAFEQTTDLLNKAAILGSQTPLGQAKLAEAKHKIMNTIYLLREEVSAAELDFKKKKSVYDAWKD